MQSSQDRELLYILGGKNSNQCYFRMVCFQIIPIYDLSVEDVRGWHVLCVKIKQGYFFQRITKTVCIYIYIYIYFEWSL